MFWYELKCGPHWNERLSCCVYIVLSFELVNKGQLSSKCPFSVFKSHRNQCNFLRISALASKKRSNQKSSVRESKSKPPIGGIKCAYFFDLTSFNRLRQKSLQKIRWFYGQIEDTKRTFRNLLTFTYHLNGTFIQRIVWFEY